MTGMYIVIALLVVCVLWLLLRDRASEQDFQALERKLVDLSAHKQAINDLARQFSEERYEIRKVVNARAGAVEGKMLSLAVAAGFQWREATADAGWVRRLAPSTTESNRQRYMDQSIGGMAGTPGY